VRVFPPVFAPDSGFFCFAPEIFSSGCIFLLPNTISLYTSYMNNKQTVAPNRHTLRRAAALQRLGQIGPFLEGSLCSFKRPGCRAPGWHLTFKQKAKTRTVYVPMEMVPEVKKWTRTHKELKKLIRQVSRHSLALIHGHVANRQAANRSKALMKS